MLHEKGLEDPACRYRWGTSERSISTTPYRWGTPSPDERVRYRRKTKIVGQVGPVDCCRYVCA